MDDLKAREADQKSSDLIAKIKGLVNKGRCEEVVKYLL